MLYVNFALGKTRTKKKYQKKTHLTLLQKKKYEDEIHGT